MGILGILLGAVCAYLLQAALYRRFWNKGLTATVEFVQRGIPEQSEGELRETIVNRKWLPLPMLRIKFEADRHLDFYQEGNVSVTDKCYKSDIFSVMAQQKIIRTLKFKGMRRGFYNIEQLNLDSTDLFMNGQLRQDIVCDTWIYVYPGQVNTAKLKIPFQKMMGELLSRRYSYEDPFEFQGIRSYQPFDSMRDINWKASARTGELYTNVHGHTVRQEVYLLLNLESESMLEYKKLKEESIRLANTLAGMFLNQGIPVGLYSNGRDLKSGKTLEVRTGTGERHLSTIREGLARLDLSQPMPEFGQILVNHLHKKMGNTLYLLISSSQREEICHAFFNLADNKTSCCWLLPLHPKMKQRVTATLKIPIVRWEVESDAS